MPDVDPRSVWACCPPGGACSRCASFPPTLSNSTTLSVEATDPKAREEIAQLRAMVDGLQERVTALARRETWPRTAGFNQLQGRIDRALNVLRSRAICDDAARQVATQILEGP